MYYYIHEDYGYIAVSEPPKKNIEEYKEITKEDYISGLMLKALKESNRNE